MMKKFLIPLGIIFALTSLGCISDAPRINPMDPALNPEISLTLQGKVERLYNSNGIDNALIALMPGNLLARSDMNGNFIIENISSDGPHTLLCEANGFASDTLHLSRMTDTTVTFKLNALPAFPQVKITTEHEAVLTPPDEYFLNLDVTVSDADNPGEVETAWFHIPDASITDTLLPVSAAGEQRFFKRIRFGSLNLFSALVGKPITFVARDAVKDTVTSAVYFITRIIEESPLMLQPNTSPPNSPVTVPFTFSWAPVALPYPFTYTIEIYPNLLVPVPPVVEITNIPATETSFEYTDALNLPADDYYWVLYVVDDFGNRSRSVKTTLSVQ